MRRWLLGAAALAFANACGGSPEPRRILVGPIIGYRPTVWDLHSTDESQHSSGYVHPAVVEAIMLHPSLPFAAEDRDLGAVRARLGDRPALVAGWLGNGRARALCGTTAAIFSASHRARMINVEWLVDRHSKANVVFDLSDTPGAFEPGASLDVETVQRTMRVAGGREP